MAATLYERALRINDFDNDGGALDIEAAHVGLRLYSAGAMTASEIKTLLGLTTAQGDDLDDVLATMPSVATATDAVARSTWAGYVHACMVAGLMGVSGYATEVDLKSKLGV